VKPHSSAANADAITQFRGEPIADEHSQRLPRAWHVRETFVDLPDI
jgi:hypothetical protein